MIKKLKKFPWDKSKIILTCGTGGVGKTTISASLATNYALQGFKTLVITIDPAKRLAQALGLNDLCEEVQNIDLKTKGKSGRLDAMMLDTKAMFDTIVDKYATDDEVKNNILNHPFYKHLSTMLAGSQEYMAMEKLYQIVNESNYDKIVVDTPPSRHALDFLDSPQNMVNAITNSILRLFIKPYKWAGKSGSRLLNIFGKVTGAQFLQELADFISSTVTLLDGFKERAQEVMRLLSPEHSSLILVTTPIPSLITDSSEFIRAIELRGLNIQGLIINKSYANLYGNNKDIKQTSVWCKKQTSKILKEIGIQLATEHKKQVHEKHIIRDLKERNPIIPIFIIPKTFSNIHNITALKKLLATITSSNQ